MACWVVGRSSRKKDASNLQLAFSGQAAVSHRGRIDVSMVTLKQKWPGNEEAEGLFVQLTLLEGLSTGGFFARTCSDELSGRLAPDLAGRTAYGIACCSQRLRHALDMSPVCSCSPTDMVGLVNEKEEGLGPQKCQATRASRRVYGIVLAGTESIQQYWTYNCIHPRALHQLTYSNRLSFCPQTGAGGWRWVRPASMELPSKPPPVQNATSFVFRLLSLQAPLPLGIQHFVRQQEERRILCVK